MEEHTQPDRAARRGRKQVEHIRSLQAKVARLERGDGQWGDVEEAYHRLVESLGQGLLIVQDGRIMLANQKMATITGYSIEELEAMSAEEVQTLVHPDDRAAVWSRYRARLAGEEPPNPFEFRGMHRDGSLRWLQLHASRIAYHGEAAVQIAYVDITDRKQFEQTKLESERRYQTLFERAPIGIGLAEMDGRIIAGNAAMGEILGYTVEELKHLDIRDVYENPDARLALLEQVKRHDGISGFSVQLRRKDGRLVDVLIGTSLIQSQGRTLLQTTCVDITEHKQTQQALQESETRYRTLIEGVPASILVLQDGKYTYVNPIGAKRLGYDDASEIVGKDPLETIDPSCHDTIRQRMISADKGQCNTPMQLKVIGKGGVTRWMESTSLPIQLEGRPATLIVGQDITERKEAEDALKESESQLKQAQEIAHVGSWSLDVQTQRLVWSEETYRIFGLPLGRRLEEDVFLNCVHPEDLATVQQAWAEALRGAPYDLEHRIMSNGDVKWVRERAVLEFDGEGRPLRGIGTVQDITERREFKKALSDSEEMFRTVFEQAAVGVAQVTPNGHFAKVNARFCEIVGYSEDELCDMNFRDITHPEDLHLDENEIARVLAGEMDSFEIEKRYVHKDGHSIWISLHSNVVRGNEDKIKYAIAVVTDISQRKQAEFALEESEQNFRAIADYTYGIELWMGADGRLIWINPAIERFSGYSVEECMTMVDFPTRLIHEEDRPCILRLYQEACEGSSGNDVQFRLVRRDDSVCWMSASWQPIYGPDGSSLGWRCSLRDITMRVQAEQQLRLHSLVLDQIQDRVTITDLSGNITHVNQAEIRSMSYSREQLIGQNVAMYGEDPAQGATQYEIIDKTKELGSWRGQIVNYARDGREIIMDCRTQVVRDREGRSIALCGVATDITKQKQAEREIRESEAKFRALFEQAPDCVALVDVETGRVVEFNDRAHQTLGYTRQEFQNIHISEFDACESREEVAVRIDRLKRAGRDTFETKYRTKDGRLLDVLISAGTISYHDRVFILSVGTDITQRKQMEEALADTSRQLHEAIRAGNIGLWDWNLDTNQVKYSPEWKRQIGYEEHEVGDSYEEWESRVHPDDLAPTLELINQAIADASSDYHAEFRFRHRDGSYRRILVQASVVRDKGGRPYRVLGSHIDLTESKQMEDALRENEERLRLAHKATNDVVWDWDIVGDRQRWNQAGTAVFGWKDIVEAPQTAAWWVERVHPEDRARVEDGFFAVVNDSALDHWQDEYRFRKADGKYAEVLDRGYVLRNERGEAVRMIGAMLDMTERKQWEERLRAMSEMLDTAPSTITVHDFEGRFLYANRKTLELHGYDENEFLALNLSDLDVPESQSLIAERMALIARQGEARFEVSHFRKDGSPIPFEIYVKQVIWEGTPAILSVGTDIRERQAMDCALHEEKERAQRYLDVAGVMMVALDAQGNVMLANRKVTEILGYDHSDVIDRGWFDHLVPKSNRAQVKSAFRKIMSGEIESLEYYENPVLTQGGEERMIAWHNTLLKDGRGRTIGTLSSGVDITEQKRATEALECHRAELQAIYDHAPVMMCVLDTDRRVVYANHAFTHFSGVSEEALRQGRACGVFGCINALEDPKGCGYGAACPDCELLRALQDTFKSGTSHHDINYRATLNQNGLRREVFLTGATALIQAGARRNVLMCLQDITQQKLVEQQARRKESELIHASRLATLGEMASGLAHELGQPLSAILLYTTACGQLMSAEHRDLQRIGKNIERIASQAERAKDIMVRVRALAQRQQPTMVRVDLNQTVTGVLDLVSWEIRQKGIQLDLNIDDQLPCVWGDTIQIEQVLLNLIRNAIEAMDIPKVEVRRLSICTRADEEQTVVVEVSDTGIGLPKSGSRRLFDAFFSTKADGLGIGLSISRTIVEMHDGTLEARSNVGSGSTFIVRLPAIAEGQIP